MRIPATRPFSRGLSSMVAGVFHRGNTRETPGVRRERSGLALALRRDDEVPVRLLALAVRVHVAAVAQVLVDDPALARGHRVERDRTPGGEDVLGGLLGLALQDALAPLAVAGGVHDDPAAPVLAVALAHHALGQVLDGLDRLAVTTDEQPQVVAVE